MAFSTLPNSGIDEDCTDICPCSTKLPTTTVSVCKCPIINEPVCGVDGETYVSECDINCVWVTRWRSFSHIWNDYTTQWMYTLVNSPLTGYMISQVISLLVHVFIHNGNNPVTSLVDRILSCTAYIYLDSVKYQWEGSVVYLNSASRVT